MKYMLMTYVNEAAWPKLSKADVQIARFPASS